MVDDSPVSPPTWAGDGVVVPAPALSDAEGLSAMPGRMQDITAAEALALTKKKTINPVLKALKRADLALVLLLVLGALGLIIGTSLKKAHTHPVASVADQYKTVQVPLGGFIANEQGLNFGSNSVVINGSLNLNSGLVIAPSVQPDAPKSGQLYFDQNTSEMAYYNGTAFVPLTGGGPVVQSLNGVSGQLTLGGGLTVVGNQLANGGVLSFGNATGAIVLGSGLSMNGDTVQNAGVLSLTSGTTGLNVASDGNGNLTITNTGAGSGTVTSGGGTTGNLPFFTASQNIEDSLVSQSGGTIVVGGDLNVSGGLSLGTALSVASGGSGAVSLTQNGVLVGNGVSAISSVTAAGPGLCLLSTGGAPNFAACPGGGGSGVSSLNGATGALTINNATASASAITIDAATNTGTKGISSFNGTNFSVAAGVVNTAQGISTGATPTFVGVNTNTITPSGTLTVGVATQSLLLKGDDTSLIVVGGVGQTTTIGFSGVPTTNVRYNFDTTPTGGPYTICTTASNCVGQGGAVAGSGTQDRLSKFTATGSTIGDSSISDAGGTVTLNGSSLVVQGGTATVGLAAQAGSLVLSDGSSNTGTLKTAALGQDTIYHLLDPGLANVDICLSTGNCAGSGGGITGTGTAGNIPQYTGSGATIGNSIISQSSSVITIAGSLSLNTALTVGNGGTGTATFTTNGVLYGNGTNALQVTLAGTNAQVLVANGSGVPTFVSFSGDVLVSNTGTTTIQPGSVALGTDTSGNYVASLGSATGITVGSNTGAGSTPTLSVNYGTSVNTAVQGNTTLVCPSGTGNLTGTGNSITLGTGGTCNPLDVVSSPTFSGTLTVQGATVTVGTTSVQGSLVLSDGSSNTGTLKTAALGQDTIYHLLNPGSPNVDICLSTGNCAGSGGGITGSGTADQLTKFTGTGTTIGDSGITDDGTNVTIGGTENLIVQGGTTTLGTAAQAGTLVLEDGSGNGISIVAATLAGSAIYTVPDVGPTATFCLDTGNCAGTGGGITGTGTAGKIPVYTGSGATIGNSIITQSGTTINIAGNLTLNTALTVANGGTGAATFTANGVLYGNGTNALQVTAAGTSAQVLVANGSGVPTFVSFSGDVAVSNSGATTIQANAVALGTDTVGSYLDSVTSGTGTTVSGAAGEGATQSVNVTYGSSASTAVQGNTTLVCPSGTGNLSGTGNTITLGSGGTCNPLDTVSSPTFSGTLTVQGATATIGTTSVQGSLVLNDGSSNTGTVKTAALGQDTIYHLVDPGSANADICLSSGNCTAIGSAGGDLTGSYPNPTIAKLQGVTLTTSSVATSNILEYNGTAWVNQSISGDIALSGTGAATIQTAAVNSAKILDGTIVNADLASGSFGNITGVGTLGALTVSGTLTVNTITPSGALVVGDTGQGFTLQGTSVSTITAANGANTTTVGFDAPAHNVTINFPALAAGSFDVCTSSGNCAGAGATLQTAYTNSVGGATPEIALDGTRGALTLRDTSGGLGTNLFEVQNNGGGTTFFSSSATATTVGTALVLQGTTSQTISMASGAANTYAVTNSSSSGATAVQALAVNLTGTNNGSGTNANSAVSFGNVAAATNNTFYGLNFGTGYTDLLRYNGTQLISGVGLIQNAAIDSAVTYSNIQKVGALTVGSIGSGFGVISTGNNITTSAALQGATATLTGANTLTLGTTGTNTGSILFKGSTAASGTITLSLVTNNPGTHTLSLPDEAGTLCSTGSVCTGYAPANGTSGTGYIWNTTTQQTANYNILSAAAGSTAASIQGAGSATVPVAIIKGGASPGAGADLLDLKDNGNNLLDAFGNSGIFTVQAAGVGNVFFTADPVSANVYVGNPAQCSGRFCVTNSPTLTTGSSYTNSYNITAATGTPSAPSTIISQDVLINDTSTGQANVLRGLRIDFTNGGSGGTNNASDTLNGIQVKIPSTVSSANYGGNLIQLQQINGGTNPNLFRVTNTGNALFQTTTGSASALVVENVAGGTTNNIFSVDSLTNQVVLGNSGATGLDGQLVFDNGTNNNTVTVKSATGASGTLTLPGETGTVCTNLSTGVCAGTWIQNQNSGTQASSNFIISGTGTAITSFVAPLLQTSDASGATTTLVVRSGNSSAGTAGNVTIDTGTTSTGTPTINVGNANAKSIQIGNNTSNPGVNIDSGTSTIAIGTGAQARQVTIGSTGAAGSVAQSVLIGTNSSAGGTNTVTIGNTAATASVTTISGGTNNGTSTAGAVVLQAGAAGSINIGNTAASKSINIGSTAALAGDSTIAIGTSTNNNQAITIGSVSNANDTTLIQGGTGATAISVQAGSAGTILIGSTTNNVLKVGNASGSLTIIGSVVIGDVTNNVTFDATNHEPVLSGNARHTRQVTLPAEYPGAVMTGDGSSNSGTMTSDNMTSTPFRNFYKWVTTQGTAQDYDIWVKVPLPSDFSAMPTGQTICVDTFASATTANGIALTLYDTSNTSVSLSDGDLTPSSTSTWQNQCTSSITGGTFAANADMTLDFKLTAPATTGDIRIGDITYSYLSKY